MKKLLVLLLVSLGVGAQSPVLQEEFIYEKAPFPACHAATLAETPTGLVAAWFGGTAEKNPDVGIWFSRLTPTGWTPPKEVASGLQPDGTRYPAWNPVLFQVPGGPLWLFFKVGPDPVSWWGLQQASTDGGLTWTPAKRLPEGILGPIKNKPLLLENGTLLSPVSTEDDGWRVHLESSPDSGRSWQKSPPLNDGKTVSAIQPSILFLAENRLQLLCRSQNDRLVQAFSADNGRSWSALTPTGLPNPNSGTDAVTLRDGRQLLVYNHTVRTPGHWGGPRSPLNVALSPDGRRWYAGLVLESQPGEYSYPAVIQTADGRVHVLYTYRREKIKHVVLDPAKMNLSREIKNGRWPD